MSSQGAQQNLAIALFNKNFKDGVDSLLKQNMDKNVIGTFLAQNRSQLNFNQLGLYLLKDGNQDALDAYLIELNFTDKDFISAIEILAGEFSFTGESGDAHALGRLADAFGKRYYEDNKGTTEIKNDKVASTLFEYCLRLSNFAHSNDPLKKMSKTQFGDFLKTAKNGQEFSEDFITGIYNGITKKEIKNVDKLGKGKRSITQALEESRQRHQETTKKKKEDRELKKREDKFKEMVARVSKLISKKAPLSKKENKEFDNLKKAFKEKIEGDRIALQSGRVKELLTDANKLIQQNPNLYNERAGAISAIINNATTAMKEKSQKLASAYPVDQASLTPEKKQTDLDEILAKLNQMNLKDPSFSESLEAFLESITHGDANSIQEGVIAFFGLYCADNAQNPYKLKEAEREISIISLTAKKSLKTSGLQFDWNKVKRECYKIYQDATTKATTKKEARHQEVKVDESIPQMSFMDYFRKELNKSEYQMLKLEDIKNIISRFGEANKGNIDRLKEAYNAFEGINNLTGEDAFISAIVDINRVGVVLIVADLQKYYLDTENGYLKDLTGNDPALAAKVILPPKSEAELAAEMEAERKEKEAAEMTSDLAELDRLGQLLGEQPPSVEPSSEPSSEREEIRKKGAKRAKELLRPGNIPTVIDILRDSQFDENEIGSFLAIGVNAKKVSHEDVDQSLNSTMRVGYEETRQHQALKKNYDPIKDDLRKIGKAFKEKNFAQGIELFKSSNIPPEEFGKFLVFSQERYGLDPSEISEFLAQEENQPIRAAYESVKSQEEEELPRIVTRARIPDTTIYEHELPKRKSLQEIGQEARVLFEQNEPSKGMSVLYTNGITSPLHVGAFLAWAKEQYKLSDDVINSIIGNDNFTKKHYDNAIAKAEELKDLDDRNRFKQVVNKLNQILTLASLRGEELSISEKETFKEFRDEMLNLLQKDSSFDTLAELYGLNMNINRSTIAEGKALVVRALTEQALRKFKNNDLTSCIVMLEEAKWDPAQIGAFLAEADMEHHGKFTPPYDTKYSKGYIDRMEKYEQEYVHDLKSWADLNRKNTSMSKKEHKENNQKIVEIKRRIEAFERAIPDVAKKLKQDFWKKRDKEETEKRKMMQKTGNKNVATGQLQGKSDRELAIEEFKNQNIQKGIAILRNATDTWNGEPYDYTEIGKILAEAKSNFSIKVGNPKEANFMLPRKDVVAGDKLDLGYDKVYREQIWKAYDAKLETLKHQKKQQAKTTAAKIVTAPVRVPVNLVRRAGYAIQESPLGLKVSEKIDRAKYKKQAEKDFRANRFAECVKILKDNNEDIVKFLVLSNLKYPKILPGNEKQLTSYFQINLNEDLTNSLDEKMKKDLKELLGDAVEYVNNIKYVKNIPGHTVMLDVSDAEIKKQIASFEKNHPEIAKQVNKHIIIENPGAIIKDAFTRAQPIVPSQTKNRKEDKAKKTFNPITAIKEAKERRKRKPGKRGEYDDL